MNKTYYRSPETEGGAFSEEIEGIRQLAAGGTGASSAIVARQNLKALGSSDWLAFEHFMFGTISPFAGSMTWTGTGSGALASAAVAGYQGVNAFTTGSASGAASSSLAVSPNNAPLDLRAVRSAIFATRVRFSAFPLDNSISDGAIFRAGFMSQRSAASNNGVYFEFTGQSGNPANPLLRLVVRDSGASNPPVGVDKVLYSLSGSEISALFPDPVSPSLAVPSTWLDLRIEILQYSQYSQYIVFYWSNSAGVGGARSYPLSNLTAGNKTGYGIHVAKNSGSVGYDVQADYVYVRLSPTQENL